MPLTEKRIAIVATNGVDAVELGVVRRRLQKEGAHTTLISLTKDPIKTWTKGNWNEAVPVDRVIEDARSQDYDALFLPGGLLNADKLRSRDEVIHLVERMNAEGKPIAAICHAPWLLIDNEDRNKSVVKGRRVTSYPSLRADLTNAGAIWVDQQVVMDGNIITSRRPDDAEAFAEQVVTLFSSK